MAFAGGAFAGGVACGGTVQNNDAITGGGSGAPGASGRGGATSSSDGGSPGAGGSTSSTDGGLDDARYVDPGCPPAMKIEGVRICDPFATVSECRPGDRCVPYVQYADLCQTEEIGTQCQPAGPGRQGDDCAAEDCAAGFVCATAGSGFKCAKLCQLVDDSDTCPSGLICSPLDVEGFFVCG
jgi:hypothetical protein